MIFAGGSPFQPDTASEWWNFVVGAIAAVGTLIALAFSNRGSLKAERQSRSETRRRIQAEKRLAEQTHAADEERRRTQESDKADRRTTLLEERAARQALGCIGELVWVGDAFDGRNRTVQFTVYNKSDYAFTDVSVRLHSPLVVVKDTATDAEGHDVDLHGSTVKAQNFQTSKLETARIERDIATQISEDEPKTINNAELALNREAIVPVYSWIFTDRYGDRWQRTSDGELNLIERTVVKDMTTAV